MTLAHTLLLTRGLLALSLLLQSLEMLTIARTIKDSTSPWRWANLQADWQHAPQALAALWNKFFGARFINIVYLQIVAIGWFILAPGSLPATLLIFTVLLIALRFRGVFNGGSDYMTVVVLTGLLVSLLSPSEKLFGLGGLFYIAAQLTLSYFVAGVVKLKTRTWRSGQALKVFLEHSNYAIPAPVRALAQYNWFNRGVSWFVILWECCFPLLWLTRPSMALMVTGLFLGNAFIFHLGNFVAFGINRFVFAWLAAYPALLYCAAFAQN